jgi:acyl dehydratase
MRRTTTRELLDVGHMDLGTTSWVVVDQARVDGFAEVTDDLQWIHVDTQRARSGPFGTTIAHGYLTLSLVSRFLRELIVVTDASSAINYGLDRLRFPAPVPVGSRIRGRAEVISAAPLESGTQTTIRMTIESDANSKPAAVADLLTRSLRGRD